MAELFQFVHLEKKELADWDGRLQNDCMARKPWGHANGGEPGQRGQEDWRQSSRRPPWRQVSGAAAASGTGSRSRERVAALRRVSQHSRWQQRAASCTVSSPSTAWTAACTRRRRAGVTGVAPRSRLKAIPTPTAAPHTPIKPQAPPGTAWPRRMAVSNISGVTAPPRLR